MVCVDEVTVNDKGVDVPTGIGGTCFRTCSDGDVDGV